MKLFRSKSTLIAFSFVFCIKTSAQHLEGFRILKTVPTTTIKDQGMSGTCWSFGTLSFMETEAIRLGKERVDLSEMFIVRYIYPEKAKNYFRTQGNTYFTAGGQTQDVLYVMQHFGLVPEAAYPQKKTMYYSYNTSILDTAVLKIIISARANEEDILSPTWQSEFETILNQELGIPPQKFTYNGQQYTPQTFCRKALGLNPEDYIQITSYTHHPFGARFCLESRYNWSFGSYYNLPLDSMMSILNRALNNGYSVVFNGDVSENSFDFRSGIATLENITPTQEKRQELFESGASTVDHIMHIVGIAEDKKGKKYYLTKNSWGNSNNCGGYVYLSEDFIRLKAVSLLVHKDMVGLMK